MNLKDVDLNLLVVLNTLMEFRSVSRAAAEMNLSQSATSHALRRLRRMFDDELLVRRGGMMQPTPAALRFIEVLRPALTQVATLLDEQRSFDPRTSTRPFVLRMSDYVAPSMFAPLCTRLRAEAPGVRLTVLPMGGVPRDRGVEPGEVHVRAERSGQALVRPTSRVLFEDDFVVLMARKHRRAAKTLTLTGYLSLPHVKVTADAVGTNMIDDVLQRHGLRRDIHLTVPSWFEMRRVIVSTDLVAVAPRHWTADPAFREGCVCHELPLDGVALSMELVWHPQDAADAGNKWLRDAITDLLAPWSKRGRHGRSAR